MTAAKLVDFSTARCDVQYGYAYITGTIINPEQEWHFEGDDTCTIISQHELLANGMMHVSGNKHYITWRMDVLAMFTTIPDVQDGPFKIVQGGKYQTAGSLMEELLMPIMQIGAIAYTGTGKSSTLEFGAYVNHQVNAVVSSNPVIALSAAYDYAHPFIIKAPYGHRIELQLANSYLEIRTIAKYKPAWHTNEDPSPISIKEANLADAQIASNLPQQMMWVSGEVTEYVTLTTGNSGVLYWLTLSQEGREKLNQSTASYNVPLTVRDMTAGTTLQVPLLIAVTE